VKLTVVAANGKEATIGILNEGDFFGEGCLARQSRPLSAAAAMTDCSVMKIEKRPWPNRFTGNRPCPICS
jgi:CRP/FNR family transcriptional regulator, cyclic AMP receptor protein